MSLQASTGIQFSNIPTAPPSPPSGIQFADEGLSVFNGDTVQLGTDSLPGAPITDNRFIDIIDKQLVFNSSTIGGSIVFEAASQIFNDDVALLKLEPKFSQIILETQPTGSGLTFGSRFDLASLHGPNNGLLSLWQVDTEGAFASLDGAGIISTTGAGGIVFVGNADGVLSTDAFKFYGGGDPFSLGAPMMVIEDNTLPGVEGNVFLNAGIAASGFGAFATSDILSWGQLDTTTGGWVLDDAFALPISVGGLVLNLAFVRQP